MNRQLLLIVCCIALFAAVPAVYAEALDFGDAPELTYPTLLEAPPAFRDKWTHVLPRAVNLWPVANTNWHAFFRVQNRPSA